MLRSSRPSSWNINPTSRILDRDQRVNEDKSESVHSEIGLLKSFLGHWASVSWWRYRDLALTGMSRENRLLGKQSKILELLPPEKVGFYFTATCQPHLLSHWASVFIDWWWEFRGSIKDRIRFYTHRFHGHEWLIQITVHLASKLSSSLGDMGIHTRWCLFIGRAVGDLIRN